MGIDHGQESQKEVTQLANQAAEAGSLRLYLTTNTHGALLLISPSFRVHKLATTADYNTFLQMYAAALAAQKQRKRRDVEYRIDDVWERFQSRHGIAKDIPTHARTFISRMNKQKCSRMSSGRSMYTRQTVSSPESQPTNKTRSHANIKLLTI